MLATIIAGHADLADLLFLVALIVFAVAAIERAVSHATDGMLVAIGLAFTAGALLVL